MQPRSKKEETVIENQSIETDSEITEMTELTDFIKGTIKIFKDLKEKCP